jgi:hypothetical protein
MLKMGVPRPAVEARMKADNVDPALLPAPVGDTRDSAPAGSAAAADTTGPTAEPPAAAAAPEPPKPDPAAEAAARHAARVKRLREEQQDIAAEAAKPLAETRQFGRFFTMLRVGHPLQVVQAKLVSAGLDPTILGADPSKPRPDTALVPLREDPAYAKYFRMLKV